MNLGSAIGTALKEGGPAAGVLILLAVLGVFDLPMPGNAPAYAAVIKPILAITGALFAYTFLPKRRTRRVVALLLVLALGVGSVFLYRHYNDAPATPETVTRHLIGAWIGLVLTYLCLGALLQGLIADLLIVFRMQTPRNRAKPSSRAGRRKTS